MGTFNIILSNIKAEFPKVQVNFKNESTFMKILGKLMFFNKSFMGEYITTIGSTIYFPTRDYVASHDLDASMILLHELVHIRDSGNKPKFLFQFLYLVPQIFSLLCIPLLFVIGWKALAFLILLTPIPAYFRYKYEKRAYTISLYAMKKLNDKYGYNANIDEAAQFFAGQFKGAPYYFMWPFQGVDGYFMDVANTVKNNGRPAFIENSIYDLMDKILNS